MTAAERQRLARILGMLGSEHAGERAAAALQAEVFRKRHGLTWEAMLSLPPVEAAPESKPEPPSNPPPPKSPVATHEKKWADPAWRRHNAYERSKGFAVAAVALGVGLAAVMHVF